MRLSSTLAGLGLCSLLLTAACVIVVDDTGGHWFGIGSGLRGSGVGVTQERVVEPFSRIQISGSTDVVVEMSDKFRVEVTADDNLISRVTTRVEDGVLRIGREGGSFSFRSGPVVRVQMPALEALSISGSSDVHVRDLSGPSFKVQVSGSADVFAQGSVQSLDVSVTGSGDQNLFNLEAQDVQVRISGSGDADVHAVKTLNAWVTGSGDVRYRGDPVQQSTSVTGSGSITRR